MGVLHFCVYPRENGKNNRVGRNGERVETLPISRDFILSTVANVNVGRSGIRTHSTANVGQCLPLYKLRISCPIAPLTSNRPEREVRQEEKKKTDGGLRFQETSAREPLSRTRFFRGYSITSSVLEAFMTSFHFYRNLLLAQTSGYKLYRTRYHKFPNISSGL